nr:MAG TPA: hypothetical protein [Caudoviricetes sp.]
MRLLVLSKQLQKLLVHRLNQNTLIIMSISYLVILHT